MRWPDGRNIFLRQRHTAAHRGRYGELSKRLCVVCSRNRTDKRPPRRNTRYDRRLHCTRVSLKKREFAYAATPCECSIRTCRSWPTSSQRFRNSSYRQTCLRLTGNRINRNTVQEWARKCAPCFANLYINELEKRFLESRLPHLRPSMWKRYIDDILCVLPHPHSELETFLRDLNEFDGDIRFTWDVSDTKANYLNIHVYKGDRIHSTPLAGLSDVDMFFKKTNKFQYVHYTSAHPPGTKKAIALGETHRHLRSTSNENSYERQKMQLVDRLRKRGYPQRFTRKLVDCFKFTDHTRLPEKVSSTTDDHEDKDHDDDDDDDANDDTPDPPQPKRRKRDDNRKESSPLVFVNTYCPWLKGEARKSILHHWNRIEGNPILKKIFPFMPTMAYRRQKNLADHLVRAKMSN